MRNMLLLWPLLLLVFSTSWSQTISPSTVDRPSSAVTRAVIIGISDYQDENISDLQYAHKDAAAFAQFLLSPAGGQLDEDHMRVMLNKEATAGNIAAALYWLVDESQEGDQAIIYFSGHGDVERKLRSQPGFLLCWDAPPQVYMAGGVIELGMLQDVISTLSLDNKTKVMVVADACRSGKLAGSDINGSQLTNANLAKQFANELKILSCQPNEYSIEGEQWGGGRGAFSFHLIDGLYGLADNNNDLSVNLLEIERYLQDQVSTEVAPHSQIPMAIGSPTERLAFVDEGLLQQIRERSQVHVQTFSSTASKGMEEVVLSEVDSVTRQQYYQFKDALAHNFFLEPKQTCAEFYYNHLIANEQLQPLHNSMRRNFAAALQDEAQQALINYLKIDPQEMKARYDQYGAKYQHHPAYLSKAAELLGPNHYLYNYFMANKYYFEALVNRLNGEFNLMPAKYDTAYVKIQLALVYNEEAPYIYNELGLILERKKSYDEAIEYYNAAAARAPTWALPIANLMITYRIQRDFDKVEEMAEKALALKPDMASVYSGLGVAAEFQDDLEKAKEHYLKAIELDAQRLMALGNLGLLYKKEKKYALAMHYYKSALEVDSNYFFGNQHMGNLYSTLGKRDSSIYYFKKVISLKPRELKPYMYLAYEYMYIGAFQKAKASLEQLNDLRANYFEYHFGITCWHALQGQPDEALVALEKAFQTGLPYRRIEKDPDIDSLRELASYKDLVKWYFPSSGIAEPDDRKDR